MPGHEVTEERVVRRLRSRPSIELFRLSNPANATAAIFIDEMIVGLHERGDAEAYYRGETHGIAAGDVCTFTAGEFVRVEHLMAPSQCSWFVLPQPEVERLSAAIGRRSEPPSFAQCTHAAPRVRDAFVNLMAAVIAEESNLRQDEALEALFARLVADCAAGAALPPPNFVPRAVRIAREYLHGFPDTDVRLADVARAARVSPYHLSHAFGRTMGISVHAYHLLVRIRHARHLLLSGLNAGETAVAAGFADQSHFTRHFKRIVGIPPGLYARGPRPLRKTALRELDAIQVGDER